MLFTFPSRYLFTIGQSVVLSLREWSPYLQTGFLVSRPTHKYRAFYLYRTITFFSASSQMLPILHALSSAGPISLATTFGVSVDFLSCRYLDVSVPHVRFNNLSIQLLMTLRPGFPIQISADQCLFTAPRSFSQCITSFFASDCQGIHQMPLPIACSYNINISLLSLYLYPSAKNLFFSLPAILSNSFWCIFSILLT